LIGRFTPIVPHLPRDDDRDDYYITTWGDYQQNKHPNSLLDGGLYGRRLPSDCTKCFYPSFRGSPGGTTGPGCEPCRRVVRAAMNFVHPFRPGCYYYSGGCYTPVYDLDPLVPGPGPFPWPFFFKRPTGG